MSAPTKTPLQKGIQVLFCLLLVSLVIFVITRPPKTPSLPRWQMQEKLMQDSLKRDTATKEKAADIDLIKGLLNEDLSIREFDFPLVILAVSGKKVVPAIERESSVRVLAAIRKVLKDLLPKLSAADSPVRSLKRINEASRFFEDGLLLGLNEVNGILCEYPKTRKGLEQRVGYPDLKITDQQSGDIFYLDPKLMQRGSESSSLRTFYFEPKDETLKITEDATHLLVGIIHDGKEANWSFTDHYLVDLAFLKVRLKAEFQASNANLYQKKLQLLNPLIQDQSSSF